jgi:hypothetical protein
MQASLDAATDTEGLDDWVFGSRGQTTAVDARLLQQFVI